MSAPVASVIVAAYNAGEFLRAAVESVLGQTMPDLELIVVDDGSTDGSTDFLSDFGDPRMKVIRQANAGQTVAKNRGIAKSTGMYIGFCDADDYWYEDKLELQLEVFRSDERLGVVYTSAQMIDVAGTEIPTYWPEPKRGDVVQHLFVNNFVPFGTALVLRKCLDSVGGFDERLRMGIDWDLWLRISTKFQFDFVPTATYAYRVWPGQMSADWEGRYASAFEIMDRFIQNNPGVINRNLRRIAYSNTYANRARARASTDRRSAFVDVFRALRMAPKYAYAWKTLARVLVGNARHG